MATSKKGIVGVIVALLLGAFGGSTLLGGVYSNVTKDFAEGISVDGTVVIDGSRNLSIDGEAVVDGFTEGGGVATLTDANGGTYTLTQAELLAANYLKFAAGGAGQAVIALTLPATSSMTSLIPSAGDCREWIYDATALAAATTTTITAGAGHELIAYTTNDDVIDGNEFAIIKMCRQADGDVTTFTSELLQAD